MITPIVITTIFSPTEQLRALANLPGVRLIVIGDAKTPKNWELPNAEFISFDAQQNSDFGLASRLPVNHYSRKNLGYLQAISTGVLKIAESDDDNAPTNWTIDGLAKVVHGRVVESRGWLNVYKFFTRERIWPRGFPLSLITQSFQAEDAPIKSVACPIHQFLAEGDPDVDAIYRLTVGKADHEFDEGVVVVGGEAVSPFNSQSTVWFENAFPYMYLPSFVEFRMTDIWRSFIALACIKADDEHLAYHGRGVWQDRNEHDAMRDFAGELDGYRLNVQIVERLMGLQLVGLSPGDRLRSCYSTLIDLGAIPSAERELLELWIGDLESMGRPV